MQYIATIDEVSVGVMVKNRATACTIIDATAGDPDADCWGFLRMSIATGVPLPLMEEGKSYRITIEEAT